MDEKDKLFEYQDNSKVIDMPVKQELEKSFLAYAMAVNVSRAIPDVRDGLKPVHRRIVYGMGELNNFYDKPFKKCARIVGEVMGKYHPHGDSSIYDALVRLAQDFSINTPLVDGHGNFGSVDGDSAAASRYTEARLSKIASEMLRDIDKDTVEFRPNYDGQEIEPVVLPSRFPNLLVNGSDGIAVGMATNIPPHNLGEVIDGVIAVIDNPEIELDELMQYIPAPDFPTQGIIMGRSGIKSAYRTGKGTFIIRGRAEIDETSTGRQRILISEIPYQVNKAKLIMSIADLVKDKRLEGISNIRDESDRNGMRIVIELKRDGNAQVILNYLYKHTQLQVSFGVINLALLNNEPKILPLKDIIDAYVEAQIEIITRRTRFDLDKAEQRLHILDGLIKALANLDDVIKTIKESKDKATAVASLTYKFELTEIQANAILDMKLQRLTGLEVEKIKQEELEVKKNVEELKGILADQNKVRAIIKTDLLEIKGKYAVPRKSEICFNYDGDIDIADLIENETVVISMTQGGYIKRMSASEYKSQHRGGVGVTAHKTKEEDFVKDIYVVNSHDELLCFSNKGKVYTLKAYEIPEAQKQAKGRAMVNLLNLSSDEKISTIIPLKKDTTGALMMATKQGLIKKTKIEEYRRINRNGKIAIRLMDTDELIGVTIVDSEDEIIIASSTGKCIRFAESNVRPLSRDTKGVRSMDLDDDEYIVDMSKVNTDCYMLTLSQNGYGKLSSPDDYRVQGRAGKGVKAGIFDETTGGLVNLKQVSLDQDIMLIADDGTMIRVKASEINIIGRNTKGVKIMRLKDNARLVCVAVAPNEESEELEKTIEDEEIKNEKLQADAIQGIDQSIQEMTLDDDGDGTEDEE